MHKSNFVTAVKVGGKVLREFDNSVYVPFGSEYTILLKNLSSVRARVSVTIDGDDALDGHTLIIDAKDSIELKRFIKNGNMKTGNAFKFIEKTAKVEKHRGNRAGDGLITVTYEFESQYFNRPNPIAITGSQRPWYDKGYRSFVQPQEGVFYSTTAQNSGDTMGYEDFWFPNDDGNLKGSRVENLPQANNSMCYYSGEIGNAGGVMRSATKTLVHSYVPPKNDAGVTAPGALTEQEFVVASAFWGDGLKHDMTIQLRGDVGQQKTVVQAPVTVKKLKRCSMCGTNVKQTAKFCHECGASVEIA